MADSTKTNPGNVHELSDEQFTNRNATAGEVKTITDAKQSVAPPRPGSSPEDIKKGAQEMLAPKKPGKNYPPFY